MGLPTPQMAHGPDVSEVLNQFDNGARVRIVEGPTAVVAAFCYAARVTAEL